jgi:hypothetical protein
VAMPEIYTEKDYSDKLVAFIDILGFQRLISQDNSEALATITIIDGHLQHVLDVLQKEHDMVFTVRLFSDCMCISCDFTTENLFYIVFELAFIQFQMSCEGFFLRGALSRGNHFENERMIFSKGLVSAYNIEKKAIYPRIVIDGELIGAIIDDNNFYAPYYIQESSKNFLIQSPDGYYSVDYLNILYQEGIDQIDALECHKASIEAAVARNLLDSRITDKYRWLAEYHNCKATEFVRPDDYEECYLSEILKSTVINISETFPHFKKIE